MLETFKLNKNINKTCLFKFKVKQCGKNSVSFLNMPEMKKKTDQNILRDGGRMDSEDQDLKDQTPCLFATNPFCSMLARKNNKDYIKMPKKGYFPRTYFSRYVQCMNTSIYLPD